MDFFDLRNSANFNGYNPNHYLSSFSDIILKHISLKSGEDKAFYCSLRLIKSSRSSVKFEIEISNDATFNEREFLSEIGIVPDRFSKLKKKMSHSKIISFKNKEDNPELYKSQIDENQLNFEILKSEYAILKESDIILIEGSENEKPSAMEMCGCSDDDSSWCCCGYEWNTYERFNDSSMSMDFETTIIKIKYDRKKWFAKFNKMITTKVVVLPNGTAKIRESALESISHSQVWENQVKTLGFYSEQDAQYFVDNWKGRDRGRGEMHDYKEALPTKEMEFVVYFENVHGKISEDIIHKKENWKPYV